MSTLIPEPRASSSVWVAGAARAFAAGVAAHPGPARAEQQPLKIGIIGAGRIGGTLASLWVKAGHEVLISSRHPDQLRELARSLGPKARAGKVVLDTGNPYPERDGEMAVEARRKGTGVASAELLPGVRLVRAFNALSYLKLRSEAHRPGEPIAI